MVSLCYIQRDENAPSAGFERVDRIACGNPRISRHRVDLQYAVDLPVKWRMHTVSVT